MIFWLLVILIVLFVVGAVALSPVLLLGVAVLLGLAFVERNRLRP